jgi:hypothetical protein
MDEAGAGSCDMIHPNGAITFRPARRQRRETPMNEQQHSRRGRRDFLLKAAAAGSAGILGLIRDALAADPKSMQGIRHASGDVTIDGRPAMPGQRIRPGQTVATGPDADTVFVLGAHAFLQRENSQFSFETSGGATTLRYLSGKVLSVFGKGKTRLITPTATIGIRGTGCYIEAEEDRTYFCLCYGVAVVTPNDNRAGRETIRTQHHEHPVYIDAGQLTMTSAPVIDHTDAELIMLENTVGRRPPFYGTDYSKY